VRRTCNRRSRPAVIREEKGQNVSFLLCVALFLALAVLVVPAATLATLAVLNRKPGRDTASPRGVSLPTRTV